MKARMNVEQYIKVQFLKSNLELYSIKITHPLDEVNFGNWSTDVSCELGSLRITNDRGEIYIKHFDRQSGIYMWSPNIYPTLLSIYDRGTRWELADLLKEIKQAFDNNGDAVEK